MIKKIIEIAKKKFMIIKYGIAYFPPEYAYRKIFNKSSIMIDIGCGYDADFSQHLIKLYNRTYYIYDQTKKHETSLKKLEKK